MTDRPLGVRLLIWLYWFSAGATALLLATLAFGEGPILLNGHSVARTEAFATLLPALGTIGLSLVGGALALMFVRRWSRAAALFPFVLMGFAPLLTGGTSVDVVRAVLVTLSVLAIAGGYLYGRPGPRAYFAPPAGPEDG